MKQNNQTDNKTSIKDHVNYSGKVSVKLTNKNKTLKKFKLSNKGLDNLFKGICYYLAKQYNSKDYVPYKLDLRKYSDGEAKYVSALINPPILQSPLVSSTTENSVSYYYTSYDATIFYNQVNMHVININETESNKDDWSKCRLYLLDSNNNALAYIDYPEDAALTPGLAVVLQWQLYVYDSSYASLS